MKFTKNSLILVDGSSYLYRAYYVFPPLKNSAGEPTGAIYGVLNMIKSLLMHYQCNYIAIIFDARGKTFRDELFENYKAHRQSMPDELRAQIKPIYEIVKALGLSLLEVDGVEADDVIGTLALEASKDDRTVLISTGDKDMAQLVSPKITLINTMTNTILGPNEVQQKYGVHPSLIKDFIAMMGDSSDNIPGIPGIGKKTAQALLHGLGNMHFIYDNLDKIANLSFRGAKTIAGKLEQNRNLAFLSYQLASIKTDVELALSHNQLCIKKPNITVLKKLFSRYEFKLWLKTLNDENQWFYKKNNNFAQKSLSSKIREIQTLEIEKAINILPNESYITILNDDIFTIWLNKLKKANIFVFTIKTDTMDTLKANIVGIAFAIKPGEAAYIPIGHNYAGVPEQLNCNKVLKQLKPLLENTKLIKVGQNIKHSLNIFKKYGIELNGIEFDIILESYCLNSISGKHDIESLVTRWLDHKTIKCKDILNKKKNIVTFNHVTIEHAVNYAAEEADIILQLHLQIWPKLKLEIGPKKIFENIEIPLLKVISRIESNGVLIDKQSLMKQTKEITARLVDLEQKAHTLIGKTFNLASIKQLKSILFEKQGIKSNRKTPSGALSTNEKVLLKLAHKYPLPKIILEYRGLSKLKSTYTNKLPFMINPITGRVHTSYHQVITSTGRLSSTNPNLQNIPVRNDEGRRIRQAFVAAVNKYIIAADYSQIELRILAHFSQDKGLLDAFLSGNDIHCTTASEVFGVEIDKVSDEQRRSAKVINFSLIYGITPFGLSNQLNIETKKAKKYIELYFKRYPGVLIYMKNTCEQAEKNGYVETIDGRRLWVPHIKSSNVNSRKAAERTAINAPIQGTAADIIKRAMIAVDDWLLKQNNNDIIKMIMQVHDELVFEVSDDVVDKASKKIRQLMESIIQLDVPLQVKLGIGSNWDQAH